MSHPRSLLVLLPLVALTAACLPDVSSPSERGRVEVLMRTGVGGGDPEEAARGGPLSQTGAPLVLEGDNGTLVIDVLSLVVSDLELEPVGGECLGSNPAICSELETGPFFVDVLAPATPFGSGFVPTGRYAELEFDVDDLAEGAAADTLLTQVRTAFPAFPAEAAMVARGTFEGQPFTVYFEAEIEVELQLPSPFTVPENGLVIVLVDADRLFRDGPEVLDLAAVDGQTVDLGERLDEAFDVTNAN